MKTTGQPSLTLSHPKQAPKILTMLPRLRLITQTNIHNHDNKDERWKSPVPNAQSPPDGHKFLSPFKSSHHLSTGISNQVLFFSAKQAPSHPPITAQHTHTQSPLANPRGLKEAVGITVFVESMKFSEAQKIPERMLLRSFQALSTLDKGKTNRKGDHV